MHVSPAAAAAGGFVLPADTISVTPACDGFWDDTRFANDTHYHSSVYLTPEGNLQATYGLWPGLKSIEKFYADFCQHVHVLRPSNDFSLDEEVDACFSTTPWLRHQWFKDNFLRWIKMLPRPSETQPGRLSYFQTPAKRARNIRTPIKPGRWLTKVFGDILTETQIHDLALEYSNTHDLKAVHITQNADEIEAIYRNGPYSCMKRGYDHEHPSRVYAGPDLGIAYTGTLAEPTARVLVWPSKKIYTDAAYGDGPRIKAALDAIGYEEAEDTEFDGARIRRLTYRGNIICPYIDVADRAYDTGIYLILGRGDLDVQVTRGLYAEAEPEYTCDEGMDEDERNYIVSIDRDVCDHCHSRNYFYCEGYEQSYQNSDLADTISGFYSDDYCRHSGKMFYCDRTDKYYPHDDYDCVVTLEGETVESSHVTIHGFFCANTEEWSLETQHQVRLINGTSVHRHHLKDGDTPLPLTFDLAA
ncbi:hypothetical protein [Ensifer soli]|uniref:hypothetical protein n=1 Tax=Ciceribacter sp. sgz301302 TaxID=3342379 RepID=UPI0035BA5764